MENNEIINENKVIISDVSETEEEVDEWLRDCCDKYF